MSDAFSEAAIAFSSQIGRLPDVLLNERWAWRAYTEEGVRFACFRVLEELRGVAVESEAERAALRQPPTQAQRIIHRHHIAFRELDGLLLPASDDLSAWPPGGGEWPLRTVLQHITQAEAGFLAVIAGALRHHRTGHAGAAQIDDGTVRAYWGSDYDRLDAPATTPISVTLALLRQIHGRVLTELADTKDAELATMSVWWEGEPMSTRFRLHRFESHMRQHMIQAEKTLAAVAGGPSESQRLARMLLSALGDAEGAMLGASPPASAARAVEHIRTVAAEVQAALSGDVSER